MPTFPPPAFSAVGLDRFDRVLQEHVTTGGVPGLTAAISRRGERHLLARGEATLGDGAIPPDAIFRIASITKPITATAAMILVEEGRIVLDEPIDALLPELADREVLRTIASEPDDTVPAIRRVTTRDLLTFTGGDGYLFAPPNRYPIQEAIEDAGIAPHPPKPGTDAEPLDPSPDAWLQRLGSLPLLNQPGERWRYHVSAEILGVLIARAAGQSLPDFMQERIFAPLGMVDTGFQLAEDTIDRFTTCYQVTSDPGRLAIYDPAHGSAWLTEPVFPNGGGDLLSTVQDLLAFGEMLLGMGDRDGVRILTPESVAMMTTDQLTETQKRLTGHDRTIIGFDGWGFGMQVNTQPTALGANPGSYGWDGGLGTSWANDPQASLVGVLLTNLSWESPTPPAVRDDFWRASYAALA